VRRKRRVSSDGQSWFARTGLVLFPGLVRGVYELIRPPIVYETETLVLRTDEGVAGFPYFGRAGLSLGLDVLPWLTLAGPTAGQTLGGKKQINMLPMFLAPVYLVIMAVWFPILVVVQ